MYLCRPTVPGPTATYPFFSVLPASLSAVSVRASVYVPGQGDTERVKGLDWTLSWGRLKLRFLSTGTRPAFTPTPFVLGSLCDSCAPLELLDGWGPGGVHGDRDLDVDVALVCSPTAILESTLLVEEEMVDAGTRHRHCHCQHPST